MKGGEGEGGEGKGKGRGGSRDLVCVVRDNPLYVKVVAIFSLFFLADFPCF